MTAPLADRLAYWSAHTLAEAREASGWWGRRRPGEPPRRAQATGPGWEPARERRPREGYEYAVRATAWEPGRGAADGPSGPRTYWSVVRRPMTGAKTEEP